MKKDTQITEGKKIEIVEVPQQQSGIVMPVMNGAQALEAWGQYQDLINKVCVDEDYQMIQDKKFRKKSGWRKIATFFNLSVDKVDESKEQIGDAIVWHFTLKATAPNGRYSVGSGSCDMFEKAQLRDGKYMSWNKWKKIFEPATPNSLHNIRSTAETRAYNRAVSNLVGGGEVSAEEINHADLVEPKVTDSTPLKPVEMRQAIENKTVSVNTCSECHAPSGRLHATKCSMGQQVITN